MKQIQDVIGELKLRPYEQDWAVIAADAARLEEFVDYALNNRPGMDEQCSVELLELVFASAEESLRAGGDARAIVGHVDRLLAFWPKPRRGAWAFMVAEYWTGYLAKLAGELRHNGVAAVRDRIAAWSGVVG